MRSAARVTAIPILIAFGTLVMLGCDDDPLDVPHGQFDASPNPHDDAGSDKEADADARTSDGGQRSCISPGDVTSRVVSLGIPLEDRYPSGEAVYARNVWDLHAFDGRLYIGGGNSSSAGPARNAGPVPIVSYDPVDDDFIGEGRVDDEQIDVYRTLNGVLVVPGHDPRGTASIGNFYRLDDNGWVKLATIPDAVHVYDLALFNGALFAAGSTYRLGGTVFMSDNDGGRWRQFPVLGDGRVHTLFEVDGVLYASGQIGTISSYTSRGGFEIVRRHAFFDGYDTNLVRIARYASFNERIVYIVAYGTNDHQWNPAGLSVASSESDAHRITLPGGTLPRDLIVHRDAVYVLSQPEDEPGTNIVFGSRDLDEWTEILRFTTDTFARSFEVLDDALYFGLGTQTEPLIAASGSILRVEPADVCWLE